MISSFTIYHFFVYDIIINANAKNILLIVSLEDFSIKVLEESSKRDELEANNYLYVNKLRRVK